MGNAESAKYIEQKELQSVFAEHCRCGRFDEVKKMVEQCRPEDFVSLALEDPSPLRLAVHNHRDHGFVLACVNGHLDIASYLYSLGGVDIRLVTPNAMETAMCGGHEHVVKYLHSLRHKYLYWNSEGKCEYRSLE